MILVDLPYGTTKLKWDTPINLEKMWELLEGVTTPNTAMIFFAQGKFSKILGASNIEQYKYDWIWEKTKATGHLSAKKMPMKAHEDILVFYNKPPTYNPQKTEGHKPVNKHKKTIENQNKSGIYGLQKREIIGGGNTDRYPRSVLKFSTVKQNERHHTTEKPVDLLEYLIKTYTNENDIVLDFTMGSGSTGVACKNTNRKFIGVELDKEYFEIAKKRVEEATNGNDN